MATHATKPEKAKPQVELPPRGDWATAEQVGAFLGVSASSVYQGNAGTNNLRWEYLEGADSVRPARRWYWPDVVALHKQRLERATERREQMNAPLRFGRRRRA